jgi:hypothetical protein
VTLPKISERDLATLRDLVFAYDSNKKFGFEGVAPLDFGGSNGSHHGATATKLVRLGLVEHKKRGWEWGQAPTAIRGSKLYRPTTAGRTAADAK